LDVEQSYEDIRAIYQAKQSHNPNAVNLLSDVQDCYIHAIVQKLLEERPIAEPCELKKVAILSFLPLQVQFFGASSTTRSSDKYLVQRVLQMVAGHRVWKGSYGIEIPLSQFKDILGKNKSSSNASSTSSNSGTNRSGSDATYYGGSSQ
jgi:hypothetical protein